MNKPAAKKPKKAKTKKVLVIAKTSLPSPKIEVVEQIDRKNKDREYLACGEDGEFHLLTSVTSSLPAPPKFVLDKWRNRVGHIRAKLSTQLASMFGTRLHEGIERLIQHPEEGYEGHIFERFLDDVDVVLGNELRVASLIYGIAGTLDFLYRNTKGELVLVDFKNHGRVYSIEEIQKDTDKKLDQRVQWSKKDKWKLQGAAYVLGVKETYGLDVDRFEVWCYNHGTGKVTKEVDISGEHLREVITRYLEKKTA